MTNNSTRNHQGGRDSLATAQKAQAHKKAFSIASTLLLLWFAFAAACSSGFENPADGGAGDKDNIESTYIPTPDTTVPIPDDTTPNPDKTTPNPDNTTSNPDNTTNPPDNTTNPPDNKPPEKEPWVELKVVSAFSQNGRDITVRFNKPVEESSGTNLANYRIQPPLKLTGATTSNNFVTLKVDPGSRIDGDTVYTVRVSNVKDKVGKLLSRAFNNSTIKRTLYVNLIWHQHQPMYLDPIKDEMQGPWVRKHATKDYYDMAAAVAPFPDVHMTINLTAVLLIQLDKYVKRMAPFYNAKTNRIDAKGFLAKWANKTDPWVDLVLRPTPDPSKLSTQERGLFYNYPWSTVSTSPQIMSFFPAYEKLRDKNRAQYTKEDLRKLKFFFNVAWFDPGFLDGPVKMPDGSVVDLTDILDKRNGKYYVKVPITEDLCNRIMAENYKIMKNTVPIHKKLQYHPFKKTGQIEIITTPFYHPILPLIYDTNLAQKGLNSGEKLPPNRFSYPRDAFDHVAKARYLYRNMFGFDPQGMWPGEGSVAEQVIPQFAQNGVRWIGTGENNLRKSQPYGQAVYYPYKVDGDNVKGDGGSTKDEVMIVFRDDHISDLIGFGIQNLSGEDAANTLLQAILKHAPRFGEKDRLVTIILDGENAWENFTKDHDGVAFFKRFYSKLQQAYQVGEIITVTPTEYIDGNPKRAVLPHPVSQQRELEPLNPGSWIDGTYRIWIGEDEETCGWIHLLKVRQDLERANVPRPNPLAPEPTKGTAAYYAYMTWESMYAAQGSDWFWWFGIDQTSPSNDDSGFDQVFRALLTAVYKFANDYHRVQKTGIKLNIPGFKPCVVPLPPPPPSGPCKNKCPKLDGSLVPDESEWVSEGSFFKDPDSDPAKIEPNDDIAQIYYAYSETKLYLGLLSFDDLHSKLGSNYQMIFYFSHRNILDRKTGKVKDDPKNAKTPTGLEIKMKPGGAAKRVVLDFSGSQLKATLQKANGSGGWSDVSTTIEFKGPVAKGKLVEMALTWTQLGLKHNFAKKEFDPLQMFVEAVNNNKSVDFAPNFGVFTIFEDASDAIFVTFEVDISGKEVPLDRYKTCCKQKPKHQGGPAKVFIVGNHPKLGMVGKDAQGKPIWVPNKIQMTQDSQQPHIWRYTVPLPKDHKVNYKYTIGTNSDENRWSGTEEFPVTFRGFLVKSTTRCIHIRDIFANKANGGKDGEIGSKSKFNPSCTR